MRLYNPAAFLVFEPCFLGLSTLTAVQLTEYLQLVYRAPGGTERGYIPYSSSRLHGKLVIVSANLNLQTESATVMHGRRARKEYSAPLGLLLWVTCALLGLSPASCFQSSGGAAVRWQLARGEASHRLVSSGEWCKRKQCEYSNQCELFRV